MTIRARKKKIQWRGILKVLNEMYVCMKFTYSNYLELEILLAYDRSGLCGAHWSAGCAWVGDSTAVLAITITMIL